MHQWMILTFKTRYIIFMSSEIYAMCIVFYLLCGVLFFLGEATGKFGHDIAGLDKRERTLNLLALFMVCVTSWWIVCALKSVRRIRYLRKLKNSPLRHARSNY